MDSTLNHELTHAVNLSDPTVKVDREPQHTFVPGQTPFNFQHALDSHMDKATRGYESQPMDNPNRVKKYLDYMTTDVESAPRIAKELRDRVSTEVDPEAYGVEGINDEPGYMSSLANPGYNQRKDPFDPNVNYDEAKGWLDDPQHRAFKKWKAYNPKGYEAWTPRAADIMTTAF